MPWQQPNLTNDDPLHYQGDPADLFDAAAEMLQALQPPAWHRQAACAGTGPDLFFPTAGQSLQPARELCARCPVRAECQAEALADPTLAGIWGGLTEKERRTLRRGAA